MRVLCKREHKNRLYTIDQSSVKWVFTLTWLWPREAGDEDTALANPQTQQRTEVICRQRQAVLQPHLLLWHTHSTGCSLQWPAEEGEVSTGAAEPEQLWQHHQQRQQGYKGTTTTTSPEGQGQWHVLNTARLQVKLFLEAKFWRLVLKCQALTFFSPFFFEYSQVS